MPKVVKERILDNAIITNRDGEVIANLTMQDKRAIRRVYDDGTVGIYHEDGREMVPPYNPSDEAPRCRHCGEYL